MTRAGAEGAIITSALVVGAVYGWRKLIEPGTSAAGKAKSPEQAIAKIIGAEPTPASVAQFGVGFGFTFFTLSIIATFAPDAAGAMAITVAVGDVLINGASVFNDINGQLGEGQVTGTVASGSGKGTAKVGSSTVKITPTGQLHG